MGESPRIRLIQQSMLLMAIVIGGAVPTFGQQARQLLGRRFWQQGGMPGYPSLVSLPTPPRELERILAKADRAMQNGQYAEAIEYLDGLLRRPDLGDFLIAEPDAEYADASFRDAALDLLARLPEAGRELYELERGAEARKQLNQALQTGDLGLLGRITRESLHTEAGREAAMLLSRYYLDQQQPMSALLLLRRLEPATQADAEFRHDWCILMAVCWQAHGRSDEAVELLRRLREENPEIRLSVRGESRPIPDSDSGVIQLLSALIAPDVAWKTSPRWLTMQGSGRRDRRTRGGMPLPRIEWTVPAVLLESESHVLAELQQGYRDQELPAVPALQPLVAGDYVIVRTPDVSLGVHLRTGKRTWMYPPLRRLDALPVPQKPGVSADSTLIRSLQLRTWEDVVHAQCSADQRRVYLLTDSALPAPETPQLAMRWQQGFGGQLEPPRMRNRLVALEMATEGKIQWIVGGEDGDEPRLSEAFFLGPPLAAYGELYLIAEIRDELRLLALAPETGKLIWSQQLLHTEPPFTVGLDESRRLTGAMPSSANGIIVCPTSASAVVAVNATTRSLVWAQRYDQGPFDDHIMFDSRLQTLVTSRPLGQRWADGFAMIAGNCVLLTPPESDQLHCLDLMTGKPRWPSVPRDEALYLAGVAGDVLAVVERRAIRSHRLLDGKPAWPPIEIPSGAMPSGRGYMSGKCFYLPTTAKEIHRVDLETGRLVESANTGVALGNLTCTDEYLISSGPDAIRAYYLRDHMRDRLVREMQTSPDDPQVLEAYANLLIGDGEWRQAVDVLSRCLDRQTDDASKERTRGLLTQTLFTALRADFGQFQDLLPLARNSVTSSADARALRMIEATGHWRAGQLDETVAVLLDLAQSHDESQADSSYPSIDHPVEASVRVNELTWLVAMLRDSFRRAPATAGDRWQSDVNRSMQHLLEAGTRSSLQAARALIPVSQRSGEWRLKIASALQLIGDPLAAELLLGPLLLDARPRTSGPAWLALAELRASENQPQAAAQAYGKALQREAETASRASPQLLATLDAWGKIADTEGRRWPDGKTIVQPSARPAGPLAAAKPSVQSLIQVEWLDSWRAVDGRVALFEPNRRDLLVMDELGRTICHLPQQIDDPVRNVAGAATLFAKSDADLVVFALGDQILAARLASADSEGASILWERNLALPGEAGLRGINVQRFQVQSSDNPFLPSTSREVSRPNISLPILGAVVDGRVTFWYRNMLECVDAQSGKTQWRRRDVAEVANVWGDDQHVYVMSTGTTARAFRLDDGAEVGQREVPARRQHWATRGRMILAFESRRTLFGRRFVELFLWDPWTESVVWQHRYNEGARGCLVESDEVAIVDADGKMEILRLSDGDEMATYRWKANEIKGLDVWRDERRYVCQLEASEKALGGARIRGPAAAVRRRPQGFSGQLIALDRETGDALWKRTAEIHQFFLPTFQPSGLPLLPMFRLIHEIPNQDEENERARPRIRHELICIDLRNGALAMRSDSAVSFRMMMPAGDPATDTISISSERGEVYRLELTADPVDDSDPALIPPLDANPAGH